MSFSNTVPKITNIKHEYFEFDGHIVRIDPAGRICMTDLWRAYGGGSLQPIKYLERKSTHKYVEYLKAKTEKNQFLNPDMVVITKGAHGATYSIVKLAMDYATTLSPAFKDEVYNAYLEHKGMKKEGWVSPDELSVLTSQLLSDGITEREVAVDEAIGNAMAELLEVRSEAHSDVQAAKQEVAGQVKILFKAVRAASIRGFRHGFGEALRLAEGAGG